MNTYVFSTENCQIEVNAHTRKEAFIKLNTFISERKLNVARAPLAGGGVIAHYFIDKSSVESLREQAEQAPPIDDFQPPYTKEEIIDDLRALGEEVNGAFDMFYVDIRLDHIAAKTKWYVENVGEH